MKDLQEQLNDFVSKNCYKKGDRGFASKEDLFFLTQSIQSKLSNKLWIGLLVGFSLGFLGGLLF